MTDDSGSASTVEQLAESFVERFRRGERPPISEYTRRYPELASQIQEVFPALVMIEQVQQDLQPDRSAPGSHPAASSLTTLGDFRILREVGRGGWEWCLKPSRRRGCILLRDAVHSGAGSG